MWQKCLEAVQQASKYLRLHMCCRYVLFGNLTAFGNFSLHGHILEACGAIENIKWKDLLVEHYLSI